MNGKVGILVEDGVEDWRVMLKCIVTDLLRQRLYKCDNYATVEESGVFCTVSVALQPLLRSAEVNMSLVARQQL
jgi:hypothetical protein